MERRTNEFGIRLALGANPADLLRLVLGRAGRLVSAGLAIGLLLALVTGRFLTKQLFGLSPHDPVLLTFAGLLFFFVALLASYIPARRAARVDPMEALRCE